MHFPCATPTTRLSVTTSALPCSPIPSQPKPSKKPRTVKPKFHDSLGGLLEDDGEGILDIARAPSRTAGDDDEPTYWILLSSDEIALASVRPKTVVAKLKRSPTTLRSQGSNATVVFYSATQFVVTTTAGHHLLYRIQMGPLLGQRESTYAYVLPGGVEAGKNWPDGPGEGLGVPSVVIRAEGERAMSIGEGFGCTCTTPSDLIISVLDPPCLRVVPFPSMLNLEKVAESPTRLTTIDETIQMPKARHARNGSAWMGLPPGMVEKESEVFMIDDWNWIMGNDDGDVTISQMINLSSGASHKRKRQPHSFLLLTSDGSAYLVYWGPPSRYIPESDSDAEGRVLFDANQYQNKKENWVWEGQCFHPVESNKAGTYIAINPVMNLVSVGCMDGTISLYHLPEQSSKSSRIPVFSHQFTLRGFLNTTTPGLETGKVTCLAWTSDGYTLAVGWALGWSTWSVFGRLGSWSVEGSLETGYGVEGEQSGSFEDHYMHGVKNLFWGPSDTELFVLCPPPVHPKHKPHDEQLFVLSFAKSAVTSLHIPDNTKHGFLQTDDRLLVYRGTDQPDMSVINPESDVWQHIKIPPAYIAMNYPIRFNAISSDARLIAIAGTRGFAHYNALNGRWKVFRNEKDEDSIRVVAGMVWWGKILVVTCVEKGVFQIRLFSSINELSLNCLETARLDEEPVQISIFDSSLLVYTVDNTLHHYLIHQTRIGVKLRHCGSIGFEGVVPNPRAVRGLSWLVPKAQQQFGDTADDLNVATIIFLMYGQMILLRPRRAADLEVKYDLQVLSDKIEFYWTLGGVGTLDNSLWGWDGKEIRVWLGVLGSRNKESGRVLSMGGRAVKESVTMALDFYPLAVLLDQGIVVGLSQETFLRKSLDFALYRMTTSTHLFIHRVLWHLLMRDQITEAVLFASHYQNLVYFSHTLEMLLHEAVELDAEERVFSLPNTPRLPDQITAAPEKNSSTLLSRVVEFLDHFDEALEVVVGCTRKTEVTRWAALFDVVGKPRDLFEKCIANGFLSVASSYLLVLHALEPVEQSSKDTVRLLEMAIEKKEYSLCRDLLRFLYSLDRQGLILRAALSQSNLFSIHDKITLLDNPPQVPDSQINGLGLLLDKA